MSITGDSSRSHTRPVATPASSQLRHAPESPQNHPLAPLVTHRVTPSTLANTLANTFASTIDTKQSSTIAEPDPKARLVMALENMATATPTRLFADRYQLLDDRVEGGQAVVCFARDAKGSMLQFAIKYDSSSPAHIESLNACYYFSPNFYRNRGRSCHRFYHDGNEFEEEVALYRDPVLRAVLPAILHANDNANGDIRSQSGYAFPPFMVLERGITMREWVKSGRNFFEVSTMVDSLCTMLDTLHSSGRMHRDLKPGALHRLSCRRGLQTIATYHSSRTGGGRAMHSVVHAHCCSHAMGRRQCKDGDHKDRADNVLYLLNSTEWRLLDLGIVANIGAHSLIGTSVATSVRTHLEDFAAVSISICLFPKARSGCLCITPGSACRVRAVATVHSRLRTAQHRHRGV